MRINREKDIKRLKDTMHPELIKAHLRMKAVDYKTIAKEVGVTNALVCQVISGKVKTSFYARHIREVIARHLEMPIADVFDLPGLPQQKAS